MKRIRRQLAVLTLSWIVLTASAPPASASFPQVSDVSVQAGLPQMMDGGYDIQPRDVNHDGWPDLLLGHHGSGAELFYNDPSGNPTSGFVFGFKFVDTIHHRTDRHGCAWGDVNRDGRDDLYCTKGARGGSVKKWNELWIQQPDGSFVDEAHAYGVEDVWGRGRHAAFLDLNHDRYPDLFVGNQYPRRDGRPTPNRTFVNVHGSSFRQVRWGLTREVGAACLQVVDINHDGWDDLLVCGQKRIKLYVRRPDNPRFVDQADRYGIPDLSARAARIVDMNGDGRPDMVICQRSRVTVRLGTKKGRFGRVAYKHRLHRGVALTIGNFDGASGPDIFVVQGCKQGVNIDDLLLLNEGAGRSWRRTDVPGDVPGCGRTAATVDFDRDGMDDVVVLNGGGRFGPGPDQLLTMGRWSG